MALAGAAPSGDPGAERPYQLLFQCPDGSSLSKVPGRSAPALSHRTDRCSGPLLPSLPQILSVTEDDPRLKPLLDTLYPMSRTEGLSWDEFLHTFSADQSPEALEFRIDLYRPEEDSWPVQVLRGCCHPRRGPPICCFRTDSCAGSRKTPRTVWGFQNNFSNRR